MQKMKTKKTSRKIDGRLSLGSFLEIFAFAGTASGAVIFGIELLQRVSYGDASINFIINIANLVIVGLITYPFYMWAHRNRRITRITIVEEQKEKSANQVDPIMTTPVDEVEPQSTQGHP